MQTEPITLGTAEMATWKHSQNLAKIIFFLTSMVILQEVRILVMMKMNSQTC